MGDAAPPAQRFVAGPAAGVVAQVDLGLHVAALQFQAHRQALGARLGAPAPSLAKARLAELQEQLQALDQALAEFMTRPG